MLPAVALVIPKSWGECCGSEKRIGHPSKRVLSDYLTLYDAFGKDQKRQLNQILFAGIISFFKRGTTEGELELRIRGNGAIKKTWEDIKKRNPMVRTSGSLGSARGLKTRTLFSSKSLSKSTMWGTVSGSFAWTATVCRKNWASTRKQSGVSCKQA